MNAEAIREIIHRQPFEQFEIRRTNGDRHLIKHPEMSMLVGSRLLVGYPETDKIAFLSLLHVAAIEMRQMA